MDYNDDYGYSYREPERQVSVQPKKQSGCMGCLLGGCLVFVLFAFLIFGVVGSFFALSINRMVDYVEENEDVVESQFEEHEDEVVDIIDDVAGFMDGLDDTFADMESDGE